MSTNPRDLIARTRSNAAAREEYLGKLLEYAKESDATADLWDGCDASYMRGKAAAFRQVASWLEPHPGMCNQVFGYAGERWICERVVRHDGEHAGGSYPSDVEVTP